MSAQDTINALDCIHTQSGVQNLVTITRTKRRRSVRGGDGCRPESGFVSLAWLIKTRTAYSRGIECWHTWPTAVRERKRANERSGSARLSSFPSGGAAQFVGREKGFPEFPRGDFHGAEENPLYPSDRRISVRPRQYFLSLFAISVPFPTCARFRLRAHRLAIVKANEFAH